ncbi:MAG: hypothetical protein EZS28_009212 [Streblomastix strix]|uniref:Uncharacterized protein n=1 Tax=Streblomastix strix TaxID=222440 RepID=A0A5J4WJR1_9EUKA|nr:MAG: hypothetical protein EZS28_009212 [Streblomastix strix]
MDKDFMFWNWSLTFKYTKQFTQLGCTAELIAGLHTEQLIESGLKNLVCDIKPVTISIKNYVTTEVTANTTGYKATDLCLNRARQLYNQRPFVVPAPRVEVWPFSTSATLTRIRTSQNIPQSHVTDFCLLYLKEARATCCFENPCNQNMQIAAYGRTFSALQCDHNSNGVLTFDGLDTQNQNTSAELRGASIYQDAADSY